MAAVLTAKQNRRIGRALHDYQMLANGDRVMIAVSGGIDSLVLFWLLDFWRHKAPIEYELMGLHLDMGFDEDSHLLVKEQMERFPVPFVIDQFQPDIPPNELDGCYHCARQRRNRLFQLAADHNCNRIAFGHHQEDIIETLFLNLFYSGNCSTMVPRQELFNGKLAIIRPLAYLTKEMIQAIGAHLAITPVPNPCPFVGNNKREEIRAWLKQLYQKNPKIRANIFAGLHNIKADYLLSPLASSREKPPQTSPPPDALY